MLEEESRKQLEEGKKGKCVEKLVAMRHICRKFQN